MTSHLVLPFVKDLVLNGLTQWKSDDGTVLITPWENLVEMDLSHNSIREIDDSVVSEICKKKKKYLQNCKSAM